MLLTWSRFRVSGFGSWVLGFEDKIQPQSSRENRDLAQDCFVPRHDAKFPGYVIDVGVGFGFQVSSFKFQVSSFKFWVLGFGFWVLGYASIRSRLALASGRLLHFVYCLLSIAYYLNNLHKTIGFLISFILNLRFFSQVEQ